MVKSENEHRYDFRVAWEHTDTAGYVHNSVYFRYFELGECEWFRELGIPWNAFPEHGFPRVHVEADFIRPLFFENACSLVTGVVRVQSAKVHLAHTLWCENEVAARGRVVFGCVRATDGRATTLPERMRLALSAQIQGGM